MNDLIEEYFSSVTDEQFRCDLDRSKFEFYNSFGETVVISKRVAVFSSVQNSADENRSFSDILKVHKDLSYSGTHEEMQLAA